MLNNTRIEPSSPNFFPSAPPMHTANLPPYSPHRQPQPQQPHHPSNYNGNMNLNPSLLSSPSPQLQPPPQSQTLNVPQMMYSVPTTTQPSPNLPMATLKPMPQPPPAPALNEVLLSEDRQRVRCPYCGASITTIVKYKTGMMSHIAACCPLAWIPYVIDMCKDVDHTCPHCGRLIGKFKRFT
ncbi:unnamed protein product [Orchesella dallaii]|uniref:LITAF domain-containing protein n=1 Tax=Orchesella dallaii TaxID=48710 RepID=A0ABP1QEN8_9HEXA